MHIGETKRIGDLIDLSFFRKGALFNDNGKWKYDVWLNYQGSDWHNWDLWSEARKALARATEQNLSGVTLSQIPPGWFMIVLEPYGETSHPICVWREGTPNKA